MSLQNRHRKLLRTALASFAPLLATVPVQSQSAEEWNVTLGKSAEVSDIAAAVVQPGLAYDHAALKEVNSYGALIDIGMGMYADHSRALVVPFNGRVREIDLENLLEGDAIGIQLDQEGFVFVETQLKFGCTYIIYALNPKDEIVWQQRFDSPYECKGADSWGISVSLYRQHDAVCAEYYERLETGEFSMKIKANSTKNYCLLDKKTNKWELQETTQGRSEEEYQFVDWSRPKGTIVIRAINSSYKTIGRITVHEADNPRIDGRTTHLVGLYSDRNRRLYATYANDTAEPLTRRVLVIYSSSGIPMSRYEISPSDKLDFGQWLPTKAVSPDGDFCFLRESKLQEQFELMKLKLK